MPGEAPSAGVELCPRWSSSEARCGSTSSGVDSAPCGRGVRVLRMGLLEGARYGVTLKVTRIQACWRGYAARESLALLALRMSRGVDYAAHPSSSSDLCGDVARPAMTLRRWLVAERVVSDPEVYGAPPCAVVECVRERVGRRTTPDSIFAENTELVAADYPVETLEGSEGDSAARGSEASPHAHLAPAAPDAYRGQTAR